jgi:PAS domain S-box-containing protein
VARTFEGPVAGGLEDVDMRLVDSLVVPASVHGVDGRFVHVNAAAEEASGLPSSFWLGRPLTVRLPPDAREFVAAQFRRAVTGEPTDFETTFIDASGSLRGVRAQQLPLRSGGDVVGVLILAFEVPPPSSEPLGLEPEPQLTPRQRQILELIAAGYSTSEIAKRLTLSTETVRNHVRNMLSELRVHTRLEAIATARRLGLLSPPALRPPD